MKLGQRLYNSVSPPAFELKSKDKQLLEHMYPHVDWNYVHCYDGIPWFMYRTFTIGTALPYTFNGSSLSIYIREMERLSVHQRLTLLVHEAFHIQQYHDLKSMGKNTSGWGFNRRFMRYYISWYFQGLYQALFKDKMPWKKATNHAYRQHPMEIPAYNHEALFDQNINLYRGHSVPNFFEHVPHLVITQAPLPQAPRFVFSLMGGGLSLLISLVKPFIESILLFFAFLLGGRKN